MNPEIVEAIGNKGESIFKDAILEYESFGAPLFRPTGLGDKWPAADYYIELVGGGKWRSGLFAQVKSTAVKMTASGVTIKLRKGHRKELHRIPGPTYLFAVHEPSRRVFVRSIGTATKAGVYSIPSENELTSRNLKRLYDEVEQFWESHGSKPKGSVFE